MKMATPKPYGESTLNNSPLLADGSDFPCKQRSGVYDAEGASNSFALGSKQPLSFIGGATHGGGSCQISLTTDKAPTKDSVFKVIHSYVGGCPIQGVAGNNGEDANAADPSTYSFTVPSDLAAGDYTLAWTWFNKIGNREMYMNCAPVTLTGGSSKRDEFDYEDLESRNYTQIIKRNSAFDALPNMFVANVGNGCTTVDSADLAFPNPGSAVESLGTSTATPSAPAGTCPTGAAGGSSGGSSAAPAPTSAASPVASAPAASSAPALSGGVFATTAVSPAATTLATSASPVASTPAADPSPVASAAPSAAPAPATGSGAALSGACTTEGEWNCIGGTSFQQCASGTWSVVQQLAAGTKCTAGQSTAIDIAASKEKKRVVRFSNAHVRRHLNHAS
jgi:hypothetical protein